MRAGVDGSGKIGTPPGNTAGRTAGQDRGRYAENRAFNDALGETLNTLGDPPDTRGKTARIVEGLEIALVAAGLFLAANLWIGS